MKSISGKRLCKIVEQKGWVLRRIIGSHHIYENPKVQLAPLLPQCFRIGQVGVPFISRPVLSRRAA